MITIQDLAEQNRYHRKFFTIFFQVSVGKFILCFDAWQQNRLFQDPPRCLPQEMIACQSMFDHMMKDLPLIDRLRLENQKVTERLYSRLEVASNVV